MLTFNRERQAFTRDTSQLIFDLLEDSWVLVEWIRTLNAIAALPECEERS